MAVLLHKPGTIKLSPVPPTSHPAALHHYASAFPAPNSLAVGRRFSFCAPMAQGFTCAVPQSPGLLCVLAPQ